MLSGATRRFVQAEEKPDSATTWGLLFTEFIEPVHRQGALANISSHCERKHNEIRIKMLFENQDIPTSIASICVLRKQI